MNAVIEQINSAGQWFVEFAWPMLLQSSVLILILLIVDLALRKKVRAVFRYWIWMLVLVKLVLPTSLSSPVSLGYWLGDKLPAVDIRPNSTEPERVEPTPMIAPPIIDRTDFGATSYTPPAEPVLPVAEPVSIKPATPPEAPETPVTWQGVAFSAWLAVAAAMGLLLLQRALFVRRLVAQAKKANGPMSEALEECRRCVGVRRKVGLKVSPNATTPAVCGLFRPMILVPQNLGSSLSSRHLRTVLLHELAHIKRGDLWVNLAQTTLQIIYFYNPLLWLANAIIRRAREQAVDEAVLVAMGETAQQYPQTLVDVAKLAFKRPALSLRLIGVVESKGALAARIKHILSRPMPKSAKLGVLGLLAVLISAAILLPMAKAAEQSQFRAKGGPLDIRLVGVVPDGSDTMYDVQGKKLDRKLGPVDVWESPWDSENQRLDFIFELQDCGSEILFDRWQYVSPVGVNLNLKTGGARTLCYSNGRRLLLLPARILRKHSKEIAHLFRVNATTRKVDLTLRYYYGPPRNPICTFAGPFSSGQKVRAGGDLNYELTPKKLWDHSPTYRCSVSDNLKLSSRSTILVYDSAGKRHLVTEVSRDFFFVNGPSLEETTAITVDEQPYERTFRNVVIDYPDRRIRHYPEYLDSMAEILGLTNRSKEKLALYKFKDADEAIAVIDIIRGRWFTMRAVEALMYGKPTIDISSLQQEVQDKIHRTADMWANAADINIRTRGIQLGLLGKWHEFFGRALELLSDEYGYLTSEEVRTLRSDLGDVVWILLNRYRQRLSAKQLEQLREFHNGKRDLPILTSVDKSASALRSDEPGATRRPGIVVDAHQDKVRVRTQDTTVEADKISILTGRELPNAGGQGELIVRLPNGVTVELIGVCEHPSEGRKWWRADGQPLGKFPYQVSAKYRKSPNKKILNVLMTIGPGSAYSATKFEVSQGYPRGYWVGLVSNGKVATHWKAGSFSISPTLEKTDVKVGIAGGPWQKMAKISPRFEQPVSEETSFGKIQWLKSVEESGSGYLVVYVENNFANRAATHLIAVDIAGKEHFPYSAKGEGIADVMTNEYEFHLESDEIRELFLVVRPYQWVTFKNVSLQPGVKTDVQVEITQALKESDIQDQVLSFGPEVKRILGLDCAWIDLESGTTQIPPSKESSNEAQLQWYRESGIDVVGRMATGRLDCLDVEMVKLDDRAWTGLSVDGLSQELKADNSIRLSNIDGFPAVALNGKSEKGTTYGFRTREGTLGLLKIDDLWSLEDEPRKDNPNLPAFITILYKLALSPAMAQTVILERPLSIGEQQYLDLDLGEYVFMPGENVNPEHLKNQGVDIYLIFEKPTPSAPPTPMLNVLGMATERAPHKLYLEQVPANSDSLSIAIAHLDKPQRLRDYGAHSIHFFRTAQGKAGAMKIKWLSDEPPKRVLQYKFLPQLDIPIEKFPWALVVNGVQSRLRARKATWGAGEIPTLSLDLRNRGEETIDFVPVAQAHCEIQIDGAWYGWAEPIIIDAPVRHLEPATELNDAISIKLTNSWALPRKTNKLKHLPGVSDFWGKRLELAPGKHTVRVRFRTDDWLQSYMKNESSLSVLSNPVEIEILPPDSDVQVEVGGESITSDRIILRLIDPNSHPVVGASVGTYVDWSDIAENPPIWFLSEGRVYKATKVKSDEQGKIALATDDLFGPEWPTERTVPLIAIDKGHFLAGVCGVSGEYLGGEITLTLQPVCRVHGRFSVSTFRKRGWSTDMLTLYTFWNKHKLCQYTSRRRQFEFLLPPGPYEIMVYSEDPTKAIRLPVVIKPGQKELDISEYLDNGNRLSSAKTDVQAEGGGAR